MISLSDEQAAMMPDIFAQSMTENPYSAQPTDMWIECTMNKGSKLKSGWKRLLKSEKGLLVHIRNTNHVNVIRHVISSLFSELKCKYAFILLTQNKLQRSSENNCTSLKVNLHSHAFSFKYLLFSKGNKS